MNQGFYPYYTNNADHNSFGYNPPRRKTSSDRQHPSTQTDSTNRLRSTSAQQILPNKKPYVHKGPTRAPLPSTKLLRPHSKSNVETFNSDKPRLSDISSQESDQQHSSMSTEFKKWSSQQKIHRLRKAKSQNSQGGGDENYAGVPQYMRHASSSYPYQGASQQRQYYGNINNYIDTQYRTRSHGHQHTRDRSHQSQQSMHSLQSLRSESNNTQLSNYGVSSSSDDFMKENMKHYSSPYTDYASPSPTQMNKMWTGNGTYQLNNQLSNTSQASNSTKHSLGSIKTINFMHRNSSISSIFSEISKHLEQCIQYLQQHIPRDYIQYMNEAMVKITFEFCGFDIDNAKKFNPLYIQLEQHLKLQHVHTTQNASKMSYFMYSGDKLIEYLKQCVTLLSSYIQSPRSIGHSVANDSLLNVLYSCYVKRHGAYCMSVYALTSFYEICYEYRSAQQQMKKMNDKLAVVKNLFNDELKPQVPSPATILTADTESSNSTTRSLGHQRIIATAPQHNMKHKQISAPVKHHHHQQQPNPIHQSKSHPEMSVTHMNNKDKSNDEVSDDGGDGRESTPVLSDINDIDHHLSSSNNMQNNIEYDSDMQSEMSATPQPTDVQRAIIQQFIPGAMNQNMPNMDVMHEMKDHNNASNKPNLPNNLHCEVSNDADDEVSSPGSMSTSTDNDTIGNDSNRFKTIKTLTPTPHTRKINTQQRTSQIIMPSPVEELRSSKSKKTYSVTPVPQSSLSNNANKSGFGKRQSWTDIAMEKIDVLNFVSNDKREFKMMQPISQQQGVDSMIKECRKSLGHNELKDDIEALRKDYPQIASTSGSASDDDNANIVDVHVQSDCSDRDEGDIEDIEDIEDEEDEFFDDEELEAKQAKYISMTQTVASVPSKPALDSLNSNDTTSSRYRSPKKNYKMIPQQHTPQNTSSHSRTSRGNNNKQKRASREDQMNHHSSRRSPNNNKKKDSNQEGLNILYDHGILNNNAHHTRNRRGSDSETGVLRYHYSNNTVQSKHRQTHHNNNNNNNNTTRGTRPRMMNYNSNSSRHSRSSSDFISANSHLFQSRPPLLKKKSSTQSYNNYQPLSQYEEDTEMAQSLSPRSATSARIYQRKPSEERSKAESPPGTRSHSSSHPRKQRRMVPAKYDQIRKNYIVRANYVDQHKSFNKYSSDRNKSWKKWIKLFQDVTAIIFVASLSCYDEILDEDNTVNSMTDQLELFDDICNDKALQNTHMIVFLNK
eukprot:512162_1